MHPFFFKVNRGADRVEWPNMKKPSIKKVLFDVVKIAFVVLAGIALVLSMMPFGLLQ